jgi:Transposase IS4
MQQNSKYCITIVAFLPVIKTNTINIAFLLRSQDGADLNHGTRVLLELLRPIANTDRVVVADSYFASVQSARELWKIRLRFIGVEKNATRQYPMHFLSRCLLPGGKGDHRALKATDPETGCQLLAIVWADRERRFFISTCCSTAPGTVIERKRWRQRDNTPNADPVLEHIRIPQPEAMEVYYKGNGKIDEHNRHRQDSLNVEKKVQTMHWHHRANHSLLAMCVVDAFDLAVGCQTKMKHLGGFRFFLEDLITDLIDNDFDRRVLRKRNQAACEEEAALAGVGVGRLDTHRQLTAPTPTKRRKSNKPEHRLQGACMVCKKSTTHVCRTCQCNKHGNKDRQYWICNKAGKECMGKHILELHTEGIGV